MSHSDVPDTPRAVNLGLIFGFLQVTESSDQGPGLDLV